MIALAILQPITTYNLITVQSTVWWQVSPWRTHLRQYCCVRYVHRVATGWYLCCRPCGSSRMNKHAEVD
jgi:hypothetical protein